VSRSAARVCAVALLGALAHCGSTPNVQGRLRADRVGDLVAGPLPLTADAEPSPCGAGEPTARGLEALRRGPYLQRVGADHATVLWTAVAGVPAIELSRQDGTPRLVPAVVEPTVELEGAVQQVVELAPLVPATLYCYRVVDAGGPLTEPAPLRTAPAPGAGTARFVGVGDSGLASSDQAAVIGQMARVAAEFVVVHGDVAYDHGTLAELERNVFVPYAPLMRRLPWFPATGNHDYGTRDAAPFREVFALPENGGAGGIERWYSFDWGPVHIAVLDSERLDTLQRDWLDADLAGSAAPWRVAVVHRPPYSSGTHGGDLGVRALVSPVFERRGVSLVLSGHDHDYERFRPQGGVHYVVSGGGGRGTRALRDRDPRSAFAIAVAHFVLVEADATRLRLWAIDATGQVFDSLVLDC
jgi:hypothetical protein